MIDYAKIIELGKRETPRPTHRIELALMTSEQIARRQSSLSRAFNKLYDMHYSHVTPMNAYCAGRRIMRVVRRIRAMNRAIIEELKARSNYGR